jgi:hypothetical protein
VTLPVRPHTLPFGRPTFNEITWLGIVLPDNAHGIVYMDDVALRIDE